MMDFHTHLLPEMDDGSRSVEESLAMLKQMAAQNINWAAATPHFYAFQESPEQFLERRGASAAQLQKEMSQWKDLPRISLGAEVRYYEGISRTEALSQMMIEGTRLLLLEMPFTTWNERMLGEIRVLQQNLGCTILIAHIERYLRFQRGQWFWPMLEEMGAFIQSNSSFF